MVDISKLLPPKSVLAMENSVCKPSLRVLIQEMVGRDRPSACSAVEGEWRGTEEKYRTHWRRSDGGGNCCQED